ncbi:F-box/LRR-repeat protein 21-like [Planococcus citri]|uniref:F-box/LRR-repeat protein 21-like n=1 Tax=Planococcus citri TaxID=170843 RepID=UPI0031F8FCB1
MATFDNLPEEIVLKIFKFVPQSCLQNDIAKVCERWQRISRDNSLYRDVHFDARLSLNMAIDVIQKYAQHINRLVISRRLDTDDILKVLPACTNLTSLTADSCTGWFIPYGRISTEVDADLISTILEKNAKLGSLRISHSTVKNGGIKIGAGHCLDTLVLKNSYYQRSIEERGLLNQAKLRVLNLQGLILNKATLYEVILKNHQTLETIKLDVWEPQLGSNDQVLNAISKCHRLNKLLIRNVSFYNISDHSIQQLTKLSHLTSLTFSKMDNVSPKSFANLFKQPHSKNYTKIHLSACEGVNSTVVRTIAKNCPNLINLTLHQPKATNGNLFTAVDLIYLASKCVQLRFLDLCYTHFSIGIAIPVIVYFLPNLKRFKYYLNSSSNPSSKFVSDTILKFLVSHLRDFDVKIGLNSHLDETITGYRCNLKS